MEEVAFQEKKNYKEEFRSKNALNLTLQSRNSSDVNKEQSKYYEQGEHSTRCLEGPKAF